MRQRIGWWPASCSGVIGLSGVLLGGSSTAASAHGVHGTGTETVGGFVSLGFTHMLLGWDHLLFVAGVVLLASRARPALTLVSLFALGHSLTLITATVAGWKFNADVVDIVIALSLVFVGVVGLFRRPKKYRWVGAAVLAFGLIHGLGLSTRLQAIGMPEDGLLIRVVAFNLGVELGQLLAVYVIYVLADLLRQNFAPAKARRVGFGSLLVVGLVASAALSYVSATRTPISSYRMTTQALGTCLLGEHAPPPHVGGSRPAKNFYEPTEPAPAADLDRAVGNGYLVVGYRPDLPTSQVAQLRAFVTSPEGASVVGAAMPQQRDPVLARTAYQTMTCPRFNLAALKSLARSWSSDPRSRTAGP
ncbi:HupE/UreJ family protein [Micromonospora sp. NPDC023966]|uniref:HupE/UreJ family protein n=1 Tax=Micromonospora sp. NPDC023966 TaxID=3154699 RepID=UPI0033EFE371